MNLTMFSQDVFSDNVLLIGGVLALSLAGVLYILQSRGYIFNTTLGDEVVDVKSTKNSDLIQPSSSEPSDGKNNDLSSFNPLSSGGGDSEKEKIEDLEDTSVLSTPRVSVKNTELMDEITPRGTPILSTIDSEFNQPMSSVSDDTVLSVSEYKSALDNREVLRDDSVVLSDNSVNYTSNLENSNKKLEVINSEYTYFLYKTARDLIEKNNLLINQNCYFNDEVTKLNDLNQSLSKELELFLNKIKKDVSISAKPLTRDFGVNTEETLNIAVKKANFVLPLHEKLETGDVILPIGGIKPIDSIKPIEPIKAIDSISSMPEIKLDNVIHYLKDQGESSSLQSKAIGSLLNTDNLQELNKGKERYILSVVNNSEVSESIAGSYNEEQLNLIKNPIQADIDLWSQKIKLLLEIPKIESELNQIKSELGSLDTKMSHLEFESGSANSSILNARISILEKLLADLKIVSAASDVGGSVESQHNVESSVSSIPVVVVSSLTISENEVNLNLLNNPMREQIAEWLVKHNPHLEKVAIPDNNESELDKIIKLILSAIEYKDFRNTNFVNDVLNKEENFKELAKIGVERKLKNSDGKEVFSYDVSKLVSALSEPNAPLHGLKPVFKSKSANPDLSQPAIVPQPSTVIAPSQPTVDTTVIASSQPTTPITVPTEEVVPTVEVTQDLGVVETIMDVFS